MKKDSFKKGEILILIFSLVFTLNGCRKQKEKAYYENTNNYITEDAVVDNIIYNEDQEHIIFWLSNIDNAYQASSFIIRGSSAQTVLKNGVLEKIKIGDTIIFTSAPAYFGNGYFMPIVQLSMGDEMFLTFEEGYLNLIEDK